MYCVCFVNEVRIYYIKAAPGICFSKVDFYVVAYLGSFLSIHLLHMSITEVRIYTGDV